MSDSVRSFFVENLIEIDFIFYYIVKSFEVKTRGIKCFNVLVIRYIWLIFD